MGFLLNIIKRYFIIAVVLFAGCGNFAVLLDNFTRSFNEPKKLSQKHKDLYRPDVRLSAIWVGHATVLVQMDDKLILTDPFITDNAAGVLRRVVEPGIDVNDLNKLDLILISHSHMDHLNFGSLEILSRKFGSIPLVFPKGIEDFLPDLRFKLVPMDNDNGYRSRLVGETKTVNGVKITSFFSVHWGGRYGVDGYIWGDTGFTGYVIEYNGQTVYFPGDTGYDSTAFKELGKKYDIDLALLPIGPCTDCDGIGRRNHVNPLGALMIFKESGAEKMIPIHYGTLTFLSDPNLPKYNLKELINKDSTLADDVKILREGERFIQRFK